MTTGYGYRLRIPVFTLNGLVHRGSDRELFEPYFLKPLNPEPTVIAVIECFFLRKSGKKTEGKAYFYNSI